MKTLIKKNFYYKNMFAGEIEAKASSSRCHGGRGMAFGGTSPPADRNIIEYVSINTLGSAVDFGDLTAVRSNFAATTNGSRAVVGGGNGPQDTIEYLTISTQGNTIDFHELTVSRYQLAATTDGSRGVFLTGGVPPPNLSSVLDYITIGATGACTDFGNYRTGEVRYPAAQTNGYRGMICGSVPYLASIEYITIGTTGNSIDSGGELTVPMGYTNGTEDGSRAVTAGGYPGSPVSLDVISYFNIGSGNMAADFGDLTTDMATGGMCNDGSRALYMGGDLPPPSGKTDQIQYLTISTLGNGVDFGEMNEDVASNAVTSGN